MITAAEFIKLFKFDFTPRWIARDSDNRITVFECEPELCGLFWKYKSNTPYQVFPPGDIAEFADKENWQDCILEIKQQAPQNWVHCLCYFWDNHEIMKELHVLKKYRPGTTYPYKASTGAHYKHCRPIKESEIKFYKGE